MSESKSIWSEDFLTLARLALAERPQDVHLFLSKVARRCRQDDPETADQISTLLKNSHNRSSSLRRENAVPIPVDNDSRLHLVRVERPSTTLVRPILSDNLSIAVDSLINERTSSAKLAAAGLVPTRSALFVGPPGVGKTLTARWVASQLGLDLLILDLSAVMSSFLGRTGNNVRAVLDYAKRQPCVLLLDELDAIAKRRDDVSEIGELKRLVTVLLQEIDEWPSSNILIAATNHSELLDPAVWRRFDRIVEFPRPTIGEISHAIKGLLKNDEVTSEWVNVLAAVLKSSNYSTVEKAVNSLRRAAILNDSSVVTEIEAYVGEAVEAMGHAARIELGEALIKVSGISQRRVSEMTGVSRDTLRKKRA